MGVVVVVGLLVLVPLTLVLCLKFRSVCSSVASWLPAPRAEEKAALTRVPGHYNANGYLVSSNSDIRLNWTGSFRRFESVDSEGALEASAASTGIPPQPLRPAPQPRGGGLSGHSNDDPIADSMQLPRAASADSVSSDTSVAAVDLIEPNIAGHLCVALDYDSECGDLVVSVIEAKDLVTNTIHDEHSSFMDTFVTVHLLPTRTSHMQTRVYRSGRSPSYKEKFLFGLEVTDVGRSSLTFHLYLAGREQNSLIGTAQLHLADLPHTRQPITTWLTLLASDPNEGSLGEILFSLSYLPTAERLTVVVVKARNLKFSGPVADPYVKVYLLKDGKKVHKKKTSVKRGDPCPIFNEAIIFSVPNNLLQSVELRLTVSDGDKPIGHVIVGNSGGGKGLSHWSQMLSSLRKPIAMWHPLLKPSPKPAAEHR